LLSALGTGKSFCNLKDIGVRLFSWVLQVRAQSGRGQAWIRMRSDLRARSGLRLVAMCYIRHPAMGGEDSSGGDHA
jgi:hypothetical protein